MLRRWLSGIAVSLSLLGCTTTPYSPPVFVEGTPDFQGLVDMLDPSRPLDVVLVHGMCTHTSEWATKSMAQLVGAINTNIKLDVPAQAQAAGPFPTIEVVHGTAVVAGNQLRFTGLVWSPLTAGLKKQLAYDKTRPSTNCAASGECSPERATLNGKFKDGLLNECLADVLAYEGVSKPIIRASMAQALQNVLDGMATEGPLVVISDSLGSKLVFDAMAEMLAGAATGGSAAKETARKASQRMAQVFMNANQMPILSLGDQSISQPPLALASMVPPAPERPSMRTYLRQRQALNLSRLMVVAFTDPNDLLSYRLLPSHFAGEYVSIGDVLVSNTKTYFSLLEDPAVAHLGYSLNPDVARVITCGRERDGKNPKCK